MARIILEVKKELSDDDYLTMTSNSSATSSETSDSKDNINIPIMVRLDRVFQQLDDIVKPPSPERTEYLRRRNNYIIDSFDGHDSHMGESRAEAWARQNQEYQNKCPDYTWYNKSREPRREAASPPPQPRKGCEIKTSADREAAVNKIYALVKDIDNAIYRKPNVRINHPPMYFSSRNGGSTTTSTSTSTRPRRDKRRQNISPAHQASRRNRIFF